jgi:hypothetical protein
MARTWRHCLQPGGIHWNQTNTRILGMAHQITRTRILAAGIKIDFADRFRVVAKFGKDGVKTEDGA